MLLENGFSRVWKQGKPHRLEGLTFKDEDDIEVVVDRVKVDEDQHSRLVAAFEMAYKLGRGEATVVLEDGSKEYFKEAFSCAACGKSFASGNFALFSCGNPSGACASCQGFGSVAQIDWDLVIPNPSKSLNVVERDIQLVSYTCVSFVLTFQY